MFQEVSPKVSFPETERAILQFWEDRRIAARSVEQRAGAPTFVFFEGPPTANGLPHPGHCLTRVVKDIFPRYKTMRGFRCERKAGWDTHGLPVEVEVCKELGLVGKEGIENYGVEPFIHRCVESVFKYTKEWEELTRRLGFWVDLPDAYVTYHQSYVESVWWALKKLFDKGLLYQSHKVVWWWPQGGTALSAGEVNEGYRDADDPSAFVRFRTAPTDGVPTSFLAWTTTPWTLPSNIALAVGADFDYMLLEHAEPNGAKERFILAEALVEKAFATLKLDIKKDLVPVRRMKGSELVGQKYEPLYRFMEPEFPFGKRRAWEVAAADFVALDTGTGIVHCAPAFGEDDYQFAKREGFGFLQILQPDGKFPPEAAKFAGLFCKDADKEILADLKERGLLLRRDTYRHPYPFCPRAENDPLIQYARKSWFIKTSEFKEQFLANNDKIRWIPEHIKEGRFGDFLRNNVDWAISRERYWGTPLPIWQCEKTGWQEALDSVDELLLKPGADGLEMWEESRRARRDEPDSEQLMKHLLVHKPYIDNITYQSPQDPTSRMRRVPEVIDCWFDSGAMPFAQWGYPHQGQERFVEQYPADFISEAIDQTRGWFYSQVAIATLLREELGKPAENYPIPFRTCIVLGFINGEDGKKLSKRLKNYRDPTYLFDAYGADALRWCLLAAQPPTSAVRFQESAIQESLREFLIRLHNVHGFFVIYANLDRFEPTATPRPAPPELAALDRWILGELHATIRLATEKLEAFDNYGAAGRLAEFVDGLSNWYVRRSRGRFWGGGLTPDKRAALWTLYDCLAALSKLLAPFTPFFADALHRNLVHGADPSQPESVHLCDWPTADPAREDAALAAEMALVREVVSIGRNARTDAKLKVRQPLAKVEILVADHRDAEAVARNEALIREELNVKAVQVAERAGDYVSFALKPNLKTLGKRLGKNLPAAAAALAKADAAAVRQALIDRGSATLEIAGQLVELGADDVMISLTANPGYAAAAGKRAVVALSTEVTPALRREGLAREVVHAVQNLRKEMGLAFADRIRLGVETAGELAAAVAEHADYIKGETLAVAILPTAPGGTAFEFDRLFCATISVAKVS